MGLSSVGPEKAWQIAVDHLKMDMPKASVDTSVQHCEFVSFENGIFTIGVYNPYNREWLARRLTSTLVRLLTGILNQTVEIQFTVLEQAVDEEENVDPEPQAHSPPDKRQRQKLFLQGRPVYPLATHYSQTWQHLPDYDAYHAALIADPALPGKWKPDENVAYLLGFVDKSPKRELSDRQVKIILIRRLSEALTIPILEWWQESFWEIGLAESLMGELLVGIDCQEAYCVQLSEAGWKEIVTSLLWEQKIRIFSG
jgi:hypothetical protein